MMPENPRKPLLWPILALVFGAVATLLAGVFSWAGINLPLNIRFPVPSPDGQYFAYFDPVRGEDLEGQTRFDLVIATSDGKHASEFPLSPGPLLWSGAGVLAAVSAKHHQVTLLPNLSGQFLFLAALPLAPGSLPVWSRDGNKLAYLRPGLRGEELAIYNLQQPQTTAISLPADFHLSQAWLLFWSPLGDEVYFLNDEADGVALEKVQLQTGQVQVLARGGNAWGPPHLRVPQLSPDGSRIYLPAPVESVIQAQTGETIWKLPASAAALWEAWSGDGQLNFERRDAPRQLFAHDFAAQTDTAVLSGVPTDGFFSADGRSYFFRDHSTRLPEDFAGRLGLWLRREWGWRQVDVATGSARPLGRQDLWPWAQTQDGLIASRVDDYKRASIGLFDPGARQFSPFVFPTSPDDRFRQFDKNRTLLVTLALYGLLGFLVLFRRAGSSPGRALSALCFLLMLTFSTFDTIARWEALPLGWPGPFQWIQVYEFRNWLTSFDIAWLPFASVLLPLSLVAVSLIPFVLLRFATVFPDGNRFLAGRKVLGVACYSVVSLPAVAALAAIWAARSVEPSRPLVLLTTVGGTVVAISVALTAMLYNLRHPSERRARNQARWVALAFSVPPAALALLMLFGLVVQRFEARIGLSPFPFFETVFAVPVLALFGLFTAAACAYALLARKLFDIQLLVRRAVRYSVMAAMVVVVYLLLVWGISSLAGGSLANPSTLVIVAAVLLTAGILAPMRERVESLVDHLFDRRSYAIREALEDFAEELPRILDRETLVMRLDETLRRTLKCRGCTLFVLDQRSNRLRPQRGRVELPREIADLEFDPAEPLCRYVVEIAVQAGGPRPLEVEVSPYDPKIIPVERSAADRLGRLGAALVFALPRRDELLGLMFVGVKESEDFFNSEDISLLSAVAHQAAVAVENTSLFEEIAHDRELRKELEVASEVQALMFPASLPRSSICELAGRCVPARSVCGDYYDFLQLPGNRIGLSIGDVSGKGASASLLMANLHELLRTEALTAENPADLARRINRQLFSASRGVKYCTFFYAILDETTKRLEFVNAGHNPPLLFNGGDRKLLESTGVPLGLFPEVTHETKSEILDPGTLMILYSDGITEARDDAGSTYGVARLASLAAAERQKSPAQLVDLILADVRAFSGDPAADDDQTLVVLKVHPARPLLEHL